MENEKTNELLKIDPRELACNKNICFSLCDDASPKKQEFYKQQRIERGFDDSETWNLDNTLSSFILPRLKVLREVTTGFPRELDSLDDWKEILDKMIRAFELELEDDFDTPMDAKNERAFNEGINLFAHFYRSLWW